MATEPTPKSTGPRGPQKKVDQLEPPSDATKYLPYGLAAIVVISLVATIIRSPAYALHAAAALLSLGALGLGYVAYQDTHSLPPEDGFRKAVGAATAATILALLGTVAMTFFPAAPYGSVTLSRAGDSGVINVAGPGANLFVETQGTFEADVGPSAQAKYQIHVTRDGTDEDLEGTFERSAGQSPLAGGNMAAAAATEATASRHWLEKLHGGGRYTVTLDRMPDNLRPPMRASIRGEPVPPLVFTGLFVVLALLVLVVDAGLARRGIEPTYAPALLLSLAVVYYLHGHFAGANVSEAMFASFLVGLLGGGLGGEVLARLSRKVLA